MTHQAISDSSSFLPISDSLSMEEQQRRDPVLTLRLEIVSASLSINVWGVESLANHILRLCRDLISYVENQSLVECIALVIS